MQVVIDIDDEYYSYLRRVVFTDRIFYRPVAIIAKGKPLPKGHGRLIDADCLRDVILLHNFHGSNKYIVPYSDRRGYRLRQREVDEGIINAPTIIKADGGDTE